MSATRLVPPTPFSFLFVLGITFAVGCPAVLGREGAQQRAEETLVRVTITTETQGSPGSVIEVGGKVIPNYRPKIIEAFPGIVIDDKGHVLTALGYRWGDIHARNPRIDITNPQGKKYAAKLIGMDQSMRIALALCQKCGLAKTPLCDRCEIRDGVRVFPLLDDSIVSQSESAQILSVSTAGGASRGGGWTIHINRPLSMLGAPLINDQHQLIGVVADEARGDPSNLRVDVSLYTVSQMLTSANKILKTGGDIQTGWLGVSVDAAADLKHGVTISDIEKDSPAQKAGLLPGDVMVKWNGTAISDEHKLGQMIQDTPIGAKAVIEVLRQGRPFTAFAVIGVRKSQDANERLVIDLQGVMAFPGTQLSTGAPQLLSSLGIEIVLLTPQLADSLQMPVQTGLLVANVTKQTAFDVAGVIAGDIILGVDGVQVGDPQTFYEHIKTQGWGSRLVLRILRKGKELSRTVQLPSRKRD